MKTIFKGHLWLLFFLILNACSSSINEVPDGFLETPPGNKPDDSWQEEETDPNTKNQHLVKFWNFEQIKAMTLQEIQNLGNKYWKPAPYFYNLEHWRLEELSPDQLYYMFSRIKFFHEHFPAKTYTHFPKIKPEQLQKLTPEHINDTLCLIIKYLDPDHIKILNKKQLLAMKFCIKSLTPDYISILNLEPIHGIFSYLSDIQKNAIIPSEYFRTRSIRTDASVNITEQVNPFIKMTTLTKEDIENNNNLVKKYFNIIHLFSCKQLSWIKSKDLSIIPPEYLANLSEEKLKCIPIDRTIGNLTVEQLRWLSFSQLKALKDNPKVADIVRFIENKGSSFFDNVKPKDIQNYEYHIQFLNPEYFQKITAEQAQQFSNRLLLALTPERAKHFRYYVQSLEPIWISNFEAKQLNSIPTQCNEDSILHKYVAKDFDMLMSNIQNQKEGKHCKITALTTKHIEAIPLHQMFYFYPSALFNMDEIQVQAFSFEQIFQLNNKQLKALISINLAVTGNTPDFLHLLKFHAIMDIAKWSGDARAEEWIENKLNPIVSELDSGSNLCYDDDAGDSYYCELFEYEMKKREKVQIECENLKIYHEQLKTYYEQLNTYYEQFFPSYPFKKEFQYDIKFCFKQYLYPSNQEKH